MADIAKVFMMIVREADLLSLPLAHFPMNLTSGCTLWPALHQQMGPHLHLLCSLADVDTLTHGSWLKTLTGQAELLYSFS